jgi:hypothetical protein
MKMRGEYNVTFLFLMSHAHHTNYFVNSFHDQHFSCAVSVRIAISTQTETPNLIKLIQTSFMLIQHRRLHKRSGEIIYPRQQNHLLTKAQSVINVSALDLTRYKIFIENSSKTNR